MNPVLLIGHDKDETFGLAPESFAGESLAVLPHRGIMGDELPSLDEISAIVLFGGSMNVDMVEQHPFLADERGYVRRAVDRGVPYLGICLGAQMLARALDHAVYPAGVRTIGFNALHPTREAENDPLLSVFDDGDMVFHWHEDTFELPEGAILLATGDQVPMQAFRYGAAAWGMQFHFEVDRPELELWLKLAGEDGVHAWGKSTEQVIEEADTFLAAQERKAREVFRRFAHVAATSV